MGRRTFIAGNWKMNKTIAEAIALVRELRSAVSMVRDRVEIAVAPPFPALHPVAKALEDSNVILAAQNCHAEASGAFTGEVAAPMLKEVGCSYVILGHSERRQLFGETDAGVNRKVAAVLKAGMLPIVCVGETLAEREANQTLSVVEAQVKGCLSGFGKEEGARFVVAYEPVWAIGTGRTATPQQAQEVHAFIRGRLAKSDAIVAQRIQILYGGSVKPQNAAELFGMADIDGGLIGGASLVAQDFIAICQAAGAR